MSRNIPRVSVGLLLAALFASGPARSDWAFGPIVSYISGVDDVVDIYEQNLLARPGVIAVDTTSFPIGAGFHTRYQADSGLRFDIGIGPAFIMLGVEDDRFGNADHTEIPIFGTVGYTFPRGSDVSGYARLGLAYHEISGDFVVDSDPGLYGALGVEFGRSDGSPWGIELAIDDSEAEFLDPRVLGNTKINTYDVMLSFFFLF